MCVLVLFPRLAGLGVTGSFEQMMFLIYKIVEIWYLYSAPGPSVTIRKGTYLFPVCKRSSRRIVHETTSCIPWMALRKGADNIAMWKPWQPLLSKSGKEMVCFVHLTSFMPTWMQQWTNTGALTLILVTQSSLVVAKRSTTLAVLKLTQC